MLIGAYENIVCAEFEGPSSFQERMIGRSSPLVYIRSNDDGKKEYVVCTYSTH